MEFKMKCVGFGEKEKKCKNEIGDTSRYWCDDCERIRRDTIKAQLEDISRSFEEGENENR